MTAPIGGPPPATAAPIVGRERELLLLRGALDRALAGRGGLVLIAGEAGIGKTALAEAALAGAADRGALLLIGRAYDLSETPPYGPWRELFERGPVGDGLPARPAAVLPPERGGEELASADAIARRVRDYLVALAARQPLVLLLEDLHWADPASLDLLRFVGRGLADAPILLVATYRADEVSGDHPLALLLPALVRESPVARLDLRLLAPPAIAALVAARYGLADADRERLVRYLVARAEGNALYVGEVLRSLEEALLLRPAPGGDGWTLGDPMEARVPPLLGQIIGARAARLGEGVGHLLAVAAVIGQAVPLDLWAAVAEADDEALADAVGRATAARVLEETPGGVGLRFAHALVRDALYEAIPLPRRRALHRRIADALIAAPHPDPDAVAAHLQRAGDPRAAAWLIQAGHRAYLTFANRTAVERYAAALDLLRQASIDPRLEGWCLVYLSQARYFDDARGGILRLEEAMRLAAVAGDRALAAIARYLLGHHNSALGDFRSAIAEMIAASVVLDDLADAEWAMIRAQGSLSFEYLGSLGLRLAYVGRYAEARTLAQRALAEGPNPRAENVLGEIHAALGEVAAALRAWERGREGAHRAGDHGNKGLFIMFEFQRTVLPYRADDLPARQRLADESERALAIAGEFLQFESVRASRLPLLVLEGEWSEASKIARDICASGRAYRPAAASLLAGMAQAQGDPALARLLIRQLLPAGPAEEPGGTWHFDALSLQRLAARIALDGGDQATARAWLTAHDRFLAWNGAVRGRAEGRLAWADYHRAAGARAEARTHAECALAHATAPRQPLALLAAHRLIGELATDDRCHADAAAHLDAALALADACAAPYERALTLLALADLHAADGQADAAGVALTEAHGILARLGARPALARADALAAHLADVAAPPPAPPARPVPGGLTAREAEVLRLVAAGSSNREAAAALSVSERTIERHLENTYRKIAARNRADAVAFALRHRLA